MQPMSVGWLARINSQCL